MAATTVPYSSAELKEESASYIRATADAWEMDADMETRLGAANTTKVGMLRWGAGRLRTLAGMILQFPEEHEVGEEAVYLTTAVGVEAEPEPEPAFGSEGASQEGPTYGAEFAPELTDLGTAPALTFREEDDSQAPYQTPIPGGTFVPGVLPESGEGQLAEIGQSGVTGVRRAKARKAATA